jgi:hypothetical protein
MRLESATARAREDEVTVWTTANEERAKTMEVNYRPPSPELFIERKWAMPNSYTFKIKVVDALLKEEMSGGNWCDPFSGMYSPAQVTNDLNPKARAIFHMDALEFLKSQPSAHYDGVLYDPPYSQRQVKECYDNIGINHWDGRMTFWSDTKYECARIVKPGGKAICFGWNSMGFGKGRGFEMKRIMLVAHGGSRNDTICTVESNIVTPIQ